MFGATRSVLFALVIGRFLHISRSIICHWSQFRTRVKRKREAKKTTPLSGLTPSAEPTQSIHLGFLAIDYLGFVLEFYGLFHVAKIRLVATLRYCSIKEAALAQDLRLRNRYLDPWLGLGPEK
jgi:hypothetical protein